MKKHFTNLVLAVALLSSGRAYSATVAWGDTIDTGIIDSSGAALPVGNYVRIGYFGTLTNSQIQANAQTPAGIAALNADFHQFAISTIGTNTGGTAGLFSSSDSPTYASLSGFTPSSQIYFWALEATNNSSITTALSTATQTAIAYVPFANNSNWQFPASDIAASKTIDLAELSNANAVILAGLYKSATSASLTPALGSPNHALQLSTITAAPEPSKMLLILAGSGLVMVRRRRRC
jgi:hypothetical protein